MNEPRSLEDWTEEFKQKIADNKVYIFAKGEKNAAMCLVVDDAAMKATLTTKKFADQKGQTQFPL